MRGRTSFSMVASIALLSLVRALTIDNQLSVVRQDCYERLAIGQRLNPKSVYKSENFNVVKDCQTICTKEKEGCKAFSFGIGAKGNGTCELSKDHVKETVDLKPIGTIEDTDFDLYIKKLGCQLVIEQPHQGTSKPAGGSHYSSEAHRPDGPHSYHEGHNSVHSETSDSHHSHTYLHDLNPSSSSYPGGQYGGSKPNSGNSYPSPHYNSRPHPDEGIGQVQTLVSVATGPQTYLHPVHGILVGDDSFRPSKPHGPPEYGGYYGNEGNMPPFRPPSLNNPYDPPPFRPRPDQHSGPDQNSQPPYNDEKPDYFVSPGASYRPRPQAGGYGEHSIEIHNSGHEHHQAGYDERPLPGGLGLDKPGNEFGYTKPINSRPDGEGYPDKPSYLAYGVGSYGSYDFKNSYVLDERYDLGRPTNFLSDRYDTRPPPRLPPRPDHDYPRPDFGHFGRPPLPNRYASVIPHPDDYDRRPENNDYLFKPPYDNYGDRQRPYDKPNSGYFYPKPSYDSARPDHGEPYDRPSSNDRYDGPISEYDKSTSRPNTTGTGSNSGYDGQPNKPSGGKPGYGSTSSHKVPNSIDDSSSSKPIVTESVGYHGEHITSIITELKDGKFKFDDVKDNVKKLTRKFKHHT